MRFCPTPLKLFQSKIRCCAEESESNKETVLVVAEIRVHAIYVQSSKKPERNRNELASHAVPNHSEMRS